MHHHITMQGLLQGQCSAICNLVKDQSLGTHTQKCSDDGWFAMSKFQSPSQAYYPWSAIFTPKCEQWPNTDPQQLTNSPSCFKIPFWIWPMYMQKSHTAAICRGRGGFHWKSERGWDLPYLCNAVRYIAMVEKVLIACDEYRISPHTETAHTPCSGQ